MLIQSLALLLTNVRGKPHDHTLQRKEENWPRCRRKVPSPGETSPTEGT